MHPYQNHLFCDDESVSIHVPFLYVIDAFVSEKRFWKNKLDKWMDERLNDERENP